MRITIGNRIVQLRPAEDKEQGRGEVSIGVCVCRSVCVFVHERGGGDLADFKIIIILYA